MWPFFLTLGVFFCLFFGRGVSGFFSQLQHAVSVVFIFIFLRQFVLFSHTPPLFFLLKKVVEVYLHFGVFFSLLQIIQKGIIKSQDIYLK